MAITLDSKKDYILSAVASGLSFLQAAALSSCSPEDISTLKQDRDFMAHLEYRQAEEEQALLELHARAIRVAADRGNTAGIQWKLSKINPQKWGDGKASEGDSPMPTETTDFSLYTDAELRGMVEDIDNVID